jgi:hypothetical protein
LLLFLVMDFEMTLVLFFLDSPATVALRELVLTGIGFVIPLDNLERENLHPEKKVRVSIL